MYDSDGREEDMLLKNGSFYYEKHLVPGDLRVTGETIAAFSPPQALSWAAIRITTPPPSA